MGQKKLYVNSKELLVEIIKSKYHCEFILNSEDDVYEYIEDENSLDELPVKKKWLYEYGDVYLSESISKEGFVVDINNPTKGIALVIYDVLDHPKLTTKAVYFLELIAGKLSTTLSYKYEDDRNDCIQSGLLDAINNWKSFNPRISNNAFSYYTQVIKMGMVKGLKELHKLGTRTISLNDETIYNI